MRRILIGIFCFSGLTFGADKYVGTITTTTANVSVSSSTTAVPFTLVKGGRYMVQCSVESCVSSVKTGSQAVRCSDMPDAGSELIAARVGQKMIYDLTLASPDEFIAVVATTGATTCEVYAVTP
jgi:hypothetical protein